MTQAPAPDPKNDPAALRVIKKPVSVGVAFAGQDGVCRTLEGAVAYRAGDAIVTAQTGESWPIARAKFDESYEETGEPGRYRKRPTLAFALRLSNPAKVPAGWRADPLSAKPGDWVLAYADGGFGVVQDSIFRETYAPAPDETRWPPP